MARPTAYRPEYAKQARKLCLLGATDVDLAEFFKVNPTTINRWKGEHCEFSKALKAGKKEADDRVERSLYQRAVGYSHAAEKLFCHEGSVVRAGYLQHYAPDTTACIFWLKNRRPDLWRDTRNVSVDGEIRLIDPSSDQARRMAEAVIESARLREPVDEAHRV